MPFNLKTKRKNRIVKTIVEKPITVRDRVRNVIENNSTLPTLDVMSQEMGINKANLSNEISVMRGLGWSIDIIGERGNPRGYVVTPPHTTWTPDEKRSSLARSMEQSGIYRAEDGTFRADQKKKKAKKKQHRKTRRELAGKQLQETIARRRNPQLDIILHVTDLDAKLTRYAKYFVVLLGVISVSIAALAIHTIIN